MKSKTRPGWMYVAVAALGGVVFALGIFGLMGGISVLDSLVSVMGFLLLGWAALDSRKYRRGTPESELDGGRTIE